MSSLDAAPSDETVRPLLRGLLHVYTFWVALAAASVLFALAPSGAARVAALIYGVGLCALFGGSGLYHRWRGSLRWKRLLRRIDHSTIFVFIAATYTPVALLVLHGSLQWIVLVCAWVGAAAGVTFSLAWIDAPRWLVAGTYLALGWIAVVALPELLQRAGIAPFVLLAAGGLLYTIGAVVYGAQRPDPWPRVFGFHEIFHTLVIAAATAHFVAIAGWVVLRAPGG
ncbi:MAG: PAQR family membrane homeostasis protein TrhA [Solirubrobacteraceae bacterium]|nr:MAG: hemolysin III [Solirubrobacterales bacterium]